MAFSDADIRNHMRHIVAPNGRAVRLSSGATIANYASVGIPSKEDRKVGQVPHSAQAKQWGQDRFTFAGIHERANGSLMKPIHWKRASEVED